jgi:hypothetical protein
MVAISPRGKSIIQVGDYLATWFNYYPIWQLSRHVVNINYPRWRLSFHVVKSIIQVGDYLATWFHNYPIGQLSRHVVNINYSRWRLSRHVVKSIIQVRYYYATWFNNYPIWQLSLHVVKNSNPRWRLSFHVGVQAYLIEKPSLELCRHLVMLRDYNISGRINLMEIPVLLHMLHFWKVSNICDVAQTVARRLAVRQARIRIPSRQRHP